MKLLLLALFFSFLQVSAQVVPDVKIAPVTFSRGVHDGFSVFLPGLKPDVALEEWLSFTSRFLSPLMPGEDHQRAPVTREADVASQEYITSSMYIRTLSQNPMTAYILLREGRGEEADTVSTQNVEASGTQFSIVFDFGNGFFLNIDQSKEAETARDLVAKYFLETQKVSVSGK